MADTEVLRFEADTERGEILLTDGRAFLGGVYDVQLIVDKHEGDANYALALFAYENQAKPLYIGKVDGSGTGRISFSQRELIECYRPQARVWNASIPIYAYLYRPLEVSEAEQEAVEELPISGEAVNPVYIIATGRIDLLWTPIYGETKDKTPVTAVGPTGPQGMQGEKGKDGVIYTPEYRYVTGEDGVTVKEIYVDFVPNVEGLATIEGLIQLKGANGRAGVDGKDGRDGVDGKSSYEIAQEAGFVGSAQDWVDLISGLPTELRDTRQLIADTQAAQKVLAEGLRENARIVSTGVNKVTGAIEEANKQVLKIGWETNKGVNTIQEVTQKAQDALNNTVEEARGFANEAGTGALKAKEWSVSAESARDEARMWRDGSLEFATKAYEHRNAAEAARGEAEGFKGQAEGFATQANTSASNASTSATNAKASEDKAKEYAEQAQGGGGGAYDLSGIITRRDFNTVLGGYSGIRQIVTTPQGFCVILAMQPHDFGGKIVVVGADDSVIDEEQLTRSTETGAINNEYGLIVPTQDKTYVFTATNRVFVVDENGTISAPYTLDLNGIITSLTPSASCRLRTLVIGNLAVINGNTVVDLSTFKVVQILGASIVQTDGDFAVGESGSVTVMSGNTISRASQVDGKIQITNGFNCGSKSRLLGGANLYAQINESGGASTAYYVIGNEKYGALTFPNASEYIVSHKDGKFAYLGCDGNVCVGYANTEGQPSFLKAIRLNLTPYSSPHALAMFRFAVLGRDTKGVWFLDKAALGYSSYSPTSPLIRVNWEAM